MLELYTHATPNRRKASMMSEEKLMETEIVRLHREGERAESLRPFAEKYQARRFERSEAIERLERFEPIHYRAPAGLRI